MAIELTDINSTGDFKPEIGKDGQPINVFDEKD